MAWIAGWSHRKTVTITGQSGAGTDYQVNLSIGDASGGDFHLENHCTSFPNDIQVTDNDQITPLDYWVEDLTLDPISMWVEVGDDLGSNADVCVYYTKSGESSASNIDNTFPFGDAFSGASLDTDKWEGDTAYASVSSGELTYDVTITVNKYLYQKAANYPIYSEVVMGCRAKMTSGIRNSIGLAQGTPSALTDFLVISYTNVYGEVAQSVRDSTSSRQSVILDRANYHNFEFIFKKDTKAEITKDGATLYDFESSYYPSENLGMTIYGKHYDTSDFTAILNWVYTRKYNSPEPAFSSAGSEESAPTGGSSLYAKLIGAGLI